MWPQHIAFSMCQLVLSAKGPPDVVLLLQEALFGERGKEGKWTTTDRCNKCFFFAHVVLVPRHQLLDLQLQHRLLLFHVWQLLLRYSSGQLLGVRTSKQDRHLCSNILPEKWKKCQVWFRVASHSVQVLMMIQHCARCNRVMEKWIRKKKKDKEKGGLWLIFVILNKKRSGRWKNAHV